MQGYCAYLMGQDLIKKFPLRAKPAGTMFIIAGAIETLLAIVFAWCRIP
jgi:hypothetical protein